MNMKRIPKQLVEKLAVNPFRRPNRYVAWNNQQLLAETVCKRCGAVLTCMGVDPRIKPRDREVTGTSQRTIIRETFISRIRTALYDTIEFEVEEPVKAFIPMAGETKDEAEPRLGIHRTTICKPCKQQLLDGKGDLQEVQQLYEADLERLAQEDDTNNTPVEQTHKVLTQLASRKVIRILSE